MHGLLAFPILIFTQKVGMFEPSPCYCRALLSNQRPRTGDEEQGKGTCYLHKQSTAEGVVPLGDPMLRGARTTQRAAGRDPGGRQENSLSIAIGGE